MKTSRKLLPLVFALTLASCGSNGGGGGGGGGTGQGGDAGPGNFPTPNPTPQEREEEIQSAEGSFRAILRPYNKTLSGWFPYGKADISISGDSLEIRTWMDDSANVLHIQNIHMGTECPSEIHDLNKDGYVDHVETLQVAKNVIVPLDANLNSQNEGLNIYPRGNFSYYQKASLEKMISDLKSPDQNPGDTIVKLAPEQALNLEGKVIIVHGAASNKVLPASVSVMPGQTAPTSIPIACGVIERLPTPTIPVATN